jgi:hypothetical protein
VRDGGTLNDSSLLHFSSSEDSFFVNHRYYNRCAKGVVVNLVGGVVGAVVGDVVADSR